MMYFFATVAGCMVVLSMVMNSRLARSTGVFQGVFVNYAVGLLTSIVVFLVCLSLGFERLAPTEHLLTGIRILAHFSGLASWPRAMSSSPKYPLSIRPY